MNILELVVPSFLLLFLAFFFYPVCFSQSPSATLGLTFIIPVLSCGLFYFVRYFPLWHVTNFFLLLICAALSLIIWEVYAHKFNDPGGALLSLFFLFAPLLFGLFYFVRYSPLWLVKSYLLLLTCAPLLMFIGPVIYMVGHSPAAAIALLFIIILIFFVGKSYFFPFMQTLKLWWSEFLKG